MNPKVVWISVIVGLLSLGVATQGVLLVAALNDPSFAVEPDYEQKAQDWDKHALQAEINRRLAWTADISTVPGGSPDDVELRLELYDTWGKPIYDGDVVIETFHNARAGLVIERTLHHEADGVYTARFPFRRPGVWEFRISVLRGATRFTRTVRKSIALRSAEQEAPAG